MNEESGFIAALLADPDDRTVLLVYADWLDDRDDSRARYLRLSAAARPNQQGLAQVGRNLDPNWVRMIANRHCRVGSRVRIREGAFADSEGDITLIAADRRSITVEVFFWGRPVPVEVGLCEVELLSQ